MNMKVELIKLADLFDKQKMHAEASLVDSIIKKIANAPPPGAAPGAPGAPNDNDKEKASLREEKTDMARLVQRLQDDPTKMSPQALTSIVSGILGQLKNVLNDVASKNPQAKAVVQQLQRRLERATS